jgi:major membrane immunogen (membrane-anchored lipoprotein)
MKYGLIAALGAAFVLAGCEVSDRTKCFLAKKAYQEFVDSGRGGAAEKAFAKKEFDEAMIKWKCT